MLEHIDLHNASLNSTIPLELGLCSNLTFLDFSINLLRGGLPRAALSGLKKMSQFGISNASLTGEIPWDAITTWTDLKSLQLQVNSLNGSISSEIGRLSNLTLLFLFINQLSGTIPKEIGNLTNLVQLDLSTNSFTGPIPPTIGNLKQLTLLNLFYNNLTGTLPVEIGDMASVQTIDINTNQLHGELPYL
ncbi:hypothetical protein QJS10_CPB18g01927 [Acorus calamus]|uniref:non-specific serine/threonine protein kinase n=1 Tax=Acorus calamus TaxID=4465 RepID=A0AAV9CLK9_ACOCL|nr:hypothetical protein QJS10_CPB18g01927 [Acorus calamus]